MDSNPRGTSVFLKVTHETVEGRVALEKEYSHRINIANEAKWPRGVQGFENASYLLGNHHTRWYRSRGGTLAQHDFLSDESVSDVDLSIAKCADNHLLRPVESVVGFLTESLPMPRVEPGSDDIVDEDSSEISTLFIESHYEAPLDIPAKLREAVQIALTFGEVWAETEYTDTGEPIEVPKTRITKIKNPVADEGDEDEEIEVEETVYGETDVRSRKDFVCRLWTMFHVDVDPEATKPEEIKYIIRSSFEARDWVIENFNVKEDGFYPENLEGMHSPVSSQHILYWYCRLQDLIESPTHEDQGGFAQRRDAGLPDGTDYDHVFFSVMDVMPTADHPRGRTLIFAGGRLIYCGQSRSWSEAYPNRWHPYNYFSWFKLAGRFGGIPLLSFIVPHQKKINAIDAVVHLNRQYLAIGQWLIPKHAKLKTGTLSAIHGEQYEYIDVPGGRAPEKVRNVALDPILLEERAQLSRSIEIIAASSLMDTEAITGSAMRADSMLSSLRRDKLRAKSPMIADFNKFVEGIAQNLLIDCQTKLRENDPALTARMRRIARNKGFTQLTSFTGADVRDHFSVKVDIASELMITPEAAEAKGLEYLQAAQGLQFLPPEEREAMRKIVGIDRYMKNQEDQAVKRARRIISKIENGVTDPNQGILIQPGVDIPRMMAPVFQRYMQTERWFALAAENPQAASVIIQLYDQMQQMIAEDQRRQMEQAVAMAKAGVKQ